MVGPTRKRRSQARQEAKTIKEKAAALEEKIKKEKPYRFNAADKEILDIIFLRGPRHEEELVDETGRPAAEVHRIVTRLAERAKVLEKTNTEAWRLAPSCEYRRRAPDGQSRDTPLTDLLPYVGRIDLGQLSGRHIIQTLNTMLYKVMEEIRTAERIEDIGLRNSELYRLQRDFFIYCEELRKWYKVESEINPGLAIDVIELRVPGLNAPGMSAAGAPVPEEEIKRRQQVVLDLLSGIGMPEPAADKEPADGKPTVEGA